jgi:hypothetical protein
MIEDMAAAHGMLPSKELRCIVRKLPRKRKFYSFIRVAAVATDLSLTAVRPWLLW